MELLEDHVPNCGRLPFKVLVRKQKVPVDRNELPGNFFIKLSCNFINQFHFHIVITIPSNFVANFLESFPGSYLELKDDDLVWFKPEDFRTGKEVVILGKNIFLYDCDPFTRHYYKTHFGVEDMERIEVVEKPKPQAPKVS